MNNSPEALANPVVCGASGSTAGLPQCEITVTVNYRHMLLIGALFMGSLAIMTAVQGYFEHSPIIVIFQFLASALLLYWALA